MIEVLPEREHAVHQRGVRNGSVDRTEQFADPISELLTDLFRIAKREGLERSQHGVRALAVHVVNEEPVCAVMFDLSPKRAAQTAAQGCAPAEVPMTNSKNKKGDTSNEVKRGTFLTRLDNLAIPG